VYAEPLLENPVKLITLVAAISLVWCASIANAAQISVVENGNGRAIYLEGTIEQGDATNIALLLQRSSPIDLVSLNSPGGDLREGIILAKLFQELRLSVLVSRSSICASACAVAFMGGRERVIQEGAVVELHAPYRPSDVNDPIEPDLEVTRSAANLKVRIFLTALAKQNGIDQLIVDYMFRQKRPERTKKIDSSAGLASGLYTRVVK
jgi:hypothetical protein